MCPNWVTNNVLFNDTEWKQHVISKDDKGNENVDFSVLIPMSEDLKIESGSGSWNINKYGWITKDESDLQQTLLPILNKYYNTEITQADYLKLVLLNLTDVEKKTFEDYYGDNLSEELKQDYTERRIKGYFNLKRYGTPDWYDWSYNNWGTKWNACESLISDNAVCFNTAWSCPIPFLQELAKHHDFKFSYADEDTGSNLGYGIAYNGDLMIHSFDEDTDLSFEEKEFLALTIQGYDYVEQKQEQAEWLEDEQQPTLLSQERQEELYDMIKGFLY